YFPGKMPTCNAAISTSNPCHSRTSDRFNRVSLSARRGQRQFAVRARNELAPFLIWHSGGRGRCTRRTSRSLEVIHQQRSTPWQNPPEAAVIAAQPPSPPLASPA